MLFPGIALGARNGVNKVFAIMELIRCVSQKIEKTYRQVVTDNPRKQFC